MNPSDTNINYDFPPELHKWIREQYGLWPDALMELPEPARLGIVQEWIMEKYRIGIEIRFTHDAFLGMVYPLPGCLVDNVYTHSIYQVKFQEAWAVAVVFALAKVQEYQDAKKQKTQNSNYYAGNYSY